MAKVASHLRVGLLALGIHLKVALHLSGSSRPCARRTPACSDHSQPSLPELLTSAAPAPGLLLVAMRGSPRVSGAILSLQSRRRWGSMPLSRAIATPAADQWAGVEAKGDGGSSNSAYGLGVSWGVAGLYGSCAVLRMWCPLHGLSCALPRLTLTLRQTLTVAGRGWRTRPATPHLAARNGHARFCWLLTVCSCVVVALLSAKRSRLLMDGASWCRGRRFVPRNSIRTSGFFILILNSLILYLARERG